MIEGQIQRIMLSVLFLNMLVHWFVHRITLAVNGF